MALVGPLAQRGIDLTLGSPRGGDLEEHWRRLGAPFVALDVPDHRGLRAADAQRRPGAGQLARASSSPRRNRWRSSPEPPGDSTSCIPTVFGPTSTPRSPVEWHGVRWSSSSTTWPARVSGATSSPRPSTCPPRRSPSARPSPTASGPRVPGGSASSPRRSTSTGLDPGRLARDTYAPHLRRAGPARRDRGSHRPRKGSGRGAAGHGPAPGGGGPSASGRGGKRRARPRRLLRAGEGRRRACRWATGFVSWAAPTT